MTIWQMEGFIIRDMLLMPSKGTWIYPAEKPWYGFLELAQNNIAGDTNTKGKVVPKLNSKLTGMAFHVTNPNKSVSHKSDQEKVTKHKNINKMVRQALPRPLKGILGYRGNKVDSCDFNRSLTLTLLPLMMELV